MTGDEIVITGISGKFPNSENIQMLQHNLLNMVDCVTDEKPRWQCGKYNIDSHFFKLHPILLGTMTPRCVL